MKENLLLVLDAGTSGVKCSLFDEKCALVDSTRADYGTDFPRPGWSEQPMEDIWAACCRAVRALLERTDAGRIACVGLSGTMNGCIPADENGRALHPNIIHSDSRAVAELDEIRAVIAPDEFYRLTGNRLDNHYTLPKILWLRKNRPEVFQKARWFLNTKDYLYAQLTGTPGVTDYSDASLTIALDIARGDWAQDMLRDLGLNPSRMPRILPGDDVSGRVSAGTARLTGLLEGTPVAVGGGDGACAARGSGLFEPGSAYACLGSSSWVSQLTDGPVLDEKARVFNYLDVDGHSCHCCGTIQCGGDALNWAVKNLLGENMSIAQAEALAMDVAPGAEGVFFLPTLMGERTPYWDPNTRGVLWGFSLYHTRAHIARAVYEGIAFALYGCAGIMAECGIPVRSLMLTGGGAQSRLWPDILAALTGVTARVHSQPGEGTSLGAAIAAGVGMGLFSYREAARYIAAKAEYPARDDWREAYAKVFPIYADIYAQMKPLFDRSAAL
ncbi:MAG: hypothetical protein IKO07_10735 [Clostridia bacterium]|nr:hypothetical protein [Clostridia bacterium]